MYDYRPDYSLTGQSLQFGSGLTSSPSGMGLTAPSSFGSNPVPSAAAGPAAGFNFGMNVPTLQMGMQGIGALGSLWGAFQASKLAREQLDFTKNVTNTNLNNQVQSYNTALQDRARARGVTEGRTDREVQDYVSANRLSR